MKVRLSKHQSTCKPLRVSYLTNISAVILHYNDTFFILNFWLIFLKIDSWAIQLLTSGFFFFVKYHKCLRPQHQLNVSVNVYIIHLEAAGQQSRVYRNLASCRTVTPWKIGSTDRGASVPSIQRTEYLLRTNVARGLRLLN